MSYRSHCLRVKEREREVSTVSSLTINMTLLQTRITPKDLTDQLLNYSRAPTTPQELIQLIRTARLQLRDIPLQTRYALLSFLLYPSSTLTKQYREEYGQYPRFWENLAKVWEKLSQSDLEDQQERDSIQAMAAFLISLTTQNGANQMQAM